MNDTPSTLLVAERDESTRVFLLDYRAELAHALAHLSLLSLLRLVTGTRWRPGTPTSRTGRTEDEPDVPRRLRRRASGHALVPALERLGSSLQEDAECCTHCAGTGLVVDEAAALAAECGGNGSPADSEPGGE
jgi:hypothetical protein